VPEPLLKDTPIYKWLRNKPVEKQALHDIRLTFKAVGIWNTFSYFCADINPDNKDIKLPTSTYCDYIDVIVTIHHTDTVSVTISCSFRPIAIDVKDLFQLVEVLTRIEIYFANTMEKSRHNSVVGAGHLPRYRSWTTKMWHFGVDTIDEYTGKEFEVTFEEGMSDLYRFLLNE